MIFRVLLGRWKKLSLCFLKFLADIWLRNRIRSSVTRPGRSSCWVKTRISCRVHDRPLDDYFLIFLLRLNSPWNLISQWNVQVLGRKDRPNVSTLFCILERVLFAQVLWWLFQSHGLHPMVIHLAHADSGSCWAFFRAHRA